MLYYKATAGCGVGFLWGSRCASAPPPAARRERRKKRRQCQWSVASGATLYLYLYLRLS